MAGGRLACYCVALLVVRIGGDFNVFNLIPPRVRASHETPPSGRDPPRWGILRVAHRQDSM